MREVEEEPVKKKNAATCQSSTKQLFSQFSPVPGTLVPTSRLYGALLLCFSTRPIFLV